MDRQCQNSSTKISDTCVACKRRQAHVGEQKMADLSLDRITPDKPPFTYVGVDCFCPFPIRRGRTEVKRYGVLYTCLMVRAVHIEVAHNLDTDSFLNSFRRFNARRRPSEMIGSDNGGNFVSGECELNRLCQRMEPGENCRYHTSEKCPMGIQPSMRVPPWRPMGALHKDNKIGLKRTGQGASTR